MLSVLECYPWWIPRIEENPEVDGENTGHERSSVSVWGGILDPGSRRRFEGIHPVNGALLSVGVPRSRFTPLTRSFSWGDGTPF